ncbi:MAG: ATP-dependent DNA helicase RecG, partial [Prevotella sp.]
VQLSEMGMQPHYVTTDKMKKTGLMSNAIAKLQATLATKLPSPMPETLPPDMTARLHLAPRDEALRLIHHPKTLTDVQRATLRLKFEELFYVQLNILRYANDNRRKYRGYVFQKVGSLFNDFYSLHLPFELTDAQKRVMREIRADMKTGRQMNRLLQGDVGSGKTLVALMTMLIALDNGFQACMMAPTEILAEQHFATIREFLGSMDVRVELLTGTVKGKRRKEVLESLAAGDVDILVGTHAIIEDPVMFSHLGVAIVDEQHRFGVAQRAKLWSKSDNPPHILVMTATPIPRTLAMTIYGDLDVSVIDQLPPGRKPIQTIHKFDSQTTSLYEGIRKQIAQGRQVYIVFPLIKESEKSDLKNLEDGYETLCQAFPDCRLSKVHGKMKPAEKEVEMQNFVSGTTQILVATTVIEVGVNVPNASVMVILDAQRFGLSQLHQLRGRVGRGAKQSYCILVTPYTLTTETRKRIDIMCSTNDGFQIAEADLKLRGPGDLEGTQQSGMAFDLKIADIARDGQIVQMARDEAQRVIDTDPHYEKPECAIFWNRLREIRQTNVNWGAIS